MSNPNLYRTLSQEEMRNINGGIPWKAIGKFLLNPSLTGKNIFHKYSGCFV